MILHVSAILSTGWGGVHTPWADIPPGRHPLGRPPPLAGRPHLARHPPLGRLPYMYDGFRALAAVSPGCLATVVKSHRTWIPTLRFHPPT